MHVNTHSWHAGCINYFKIMKNIETKYIKLPIQVKYLRDASISISRGEDRKCVLISGRMKFLWLKYCLQFESRKWNVNTCQATQSVRSMTTTVENHAWKYSMLVIVKGWGEVHLKMGAHRMAELHMSVSLSFLLIFSLIFFESLFLSMKNDGLNQIQIC